MAKQTKKLSKNVEAIHLCIQILESLGYNASETKRMLISATTYTIKGDKHIYHCLLHKK